MTTKTVMITGGSKGIGLATAGLLLEKGFRVILLAREEARLKTVKTDFVRRGFKARDIEIAAVDVGDAAALTALVPQLQLTRGGLFGLVNNAASEILKRVTEYDLADLDQMWRVNMLAPIVLIRACHPHLKKARGSVVNMGSVSDHQHYATYSVYGATKAFLVSFSQHAAKEFGRDGIRINVVTPGGVDTPLMRRICKQFSRAEVRQAQAAVPLGGRWATPREIAEAIHFALTGPRYLHGGDIRIHGGCE